MSQLQESKVSTLSDPNLDRKAQWADQAILGRPAGFVGGTDIDSASDRSRRAVAGAHSTDAFLFGDLQVAGSPTPGSNNRYEHSTSNRKRREGTHHSAAARDRFATEVPPTGGLLHLGGEKGRKTRRSVARSATPNVMIAELPFATSALQDDAERRLTRLPDARPYRGMQRVRRSSLPTSQPGTAFTAPRGLQATPMERAWPKDLADHQFLGTNGTVDLVTPLTGFENPAADIHSATDSPSVPPSDLLSGTYQRLSQLLAKPEVGGYLVMGTLIACSFFV